MHDGDYTAILCGLDYDYVLSQGAYWQALFQMVRRARLRGMKAVRFSMDADVERSRYGTTVIPNVIHVQAREHHNAADLRDIVAEVAVQEDRRDRAAA